MDEEIALKDNRRRRVGMLTEEVFWRRIQKPVGCWLYDGAREINGYGYLKNPFGEEPKFITAHRVAWIYKYGPIPDGMRVLHKCDVRACVNPDHLFLGTDKDNHADMRKKGRMSAKLTHADVREIKRLLAEGMMGKDIAARFKVTASCISDIKNGDNWKHVA